MTIKQQLTKSVNKPLKKLFGQSTRIEHNINVPPDEKFGDYSTNVALMLAKQLKIPAAQVAAKITDYLKKNYKNYFERIEVVSPGFINFFLSKKYLLSQSKKILFKKGAYFNTLVGKKRKIQIEFISANPTGPLTVGNARGGFIGDVLANVIQACGYKVIKEYLINDAGHQIKLLAHSVLKDEQATYTGNYIDQLNKQNKFTELSQVGFWAAQQILENYIKKTIAKLNINFDVWYSEQKEIRNKDKINKLIVNLKKKKIVYQNDGALWFKSAAYGDDKDRVLIKADGEPTYFAQDFAYHQNKFERGFDKVINIWGADHHGDVNRLKAAVKVLGHEGKLDVILTQFIRLIKNGQEVRMSKRAGNLVYIDDLINEVGVDVTRFYFLKYSANSHINFDLNQAKERSEKNPVYYVQYAYARICSILKQEAITRPSKIITTPLSSGYEFGLIKEIIKMPDLLMEISQNYQVQNLTAYAVNLADKFHQFYTNCRIIDQGQLFQERLNLTLATKITFEKLFKILGISAPEKM